MKVFRRRGAVVHINIPVAIINVVLLYGFFFVTDYFIKIRGVTIRGFFCVDPSIHYTQKPSTVTSIQHRIYNISLMVISVFIVELIQQYQKKTKITFTYKIGKMSIPKYSVQVLTFIGYSQVGYIVNELLVKFVKSFVGRLRPYFIAACNPLPIQECKNLNPNTYIENYQCQGDTLAVEEARKSFYSGHSTVTMYCAFWTVLYLQARLKTAIQNSVIVSVLQTLIMAGGLYVCCSRISDNKHHDGDVLVGIAVGMLLAAISTIWWAKLFSQVDVGADLDDEEKYEFDAKEII